MGLKRCKLKARVQRRLLEFFVLEVTARASADLMDIQANTATLFYNKIRIVIAKKLETDASLFAGEIELDESYFGGVRKGKRGRGAIGKVPVFGILKRGGKVYTQVIDNTKTDTLMPIIRRKIRPDSIMAIAHTTLWMFLSSSTSGSIIRSYLPTSKIILTVLKTFGTRQRGYLESIMVSPSRISIYS